MAESRNQPAAEVRIVIVHLGSEAYGIPIEHVYTVITLQEITRVPQTPSCVRGLMNLRGQVLPVIDLSTRFDLPKGEDGPKTRAVIVNVDGTSAGLVVDEVSKVVSLSTAQLEAPSELMNSRARECISAIGKTPADSTDGTQRERLVLVLDVRRVLAGLEDGRLDSTTCATEDRSGRELRLSA